MRIILAILLSAFVANALAQSVGGGFGMGMSTTLLGPANDPPLPLGIP